MFAIAKDLVLSSCRVNWIATGTFSLPSAERNNQTLACVARRSMIWSWSRLSCSRLVARFEIRFFFWACPASAPSPASEAPVPSVLAAGGLH